MMSSSGRNSELHLAFFVQDLRGGGAERAVVRIANGLVEAGARVDLVLVKQAGAFLDELDAKVNLIALGSNRTAFAVATLRGYLKRSRPDVLFSTMTHANV